MKCIKFYLKGFNFYEEFSRLKETKQFKLVDPLQDLNTKEYLVFSYEGNEKEINELGINIHFETFIINNNN